jgi:hypothetical protein
MKSRVLVSALAALAMSTLAHADPLGSPFSATDSYSPSVPVSAFARPASWFDPSKLHMSMEASFGTGFNGQSSGLQVTRFSYQVARPLAMQVSIGNAFGAGAANGTNGQFFLEGLNMTYQPFKSMMISVNYRNLRSPLQYGYGYDNGLYPFGYAPSSGRLTP